MQHCSRFGFIALLILATVQAAWAGRVGSEFRVNSKTTGAQVAPKVAVLKNGDFVVIWLGKDGANVSVFGQRYSANGTRKGKEFRAVTNTGWSLENPTIAAISTGGFVVAVHIKANGFGHIYAQRFDAAGVRLGNAVKVNKTQSQDPEPMSATVASLTNGHFVIAYNAGSQNDAVRGIFAQRFTASGKKDGDEIPVSLDGHRDYEPVVAGLSNGGFVILWTRQEAPSTTLLSGPDVLGQVFDASGVRVGVRFVFHSTLPSSQDRPAVAALNDVGHFVGSWTSFDASGSFSEEIYGRIGSGSGPACCEFRVNTYRTGAQTAPSIARLTDDSFVIVWVSENQNGARRAGDIYGQRYNIIGKKIGGEFRVNKTTTSDQSSPSVAALNDGGFVVVWQSWLQDGSLEGIYGQRFAP